MAVGGHRKGPKRGLTLVEVLLAVFVLACAAMPVLVMVYTGSRESSESENVMFAAMLASSTLERHLSRGYDELARNLPFSQVLEGTPPGDEPAAGHAEFAMKFAGTQPFKVDLKITSVRDGLLALEAIVRWGKVSGKGEHRFAITRLLAQPDLSIRARPPLGGSGP